jgi:CheY-like chemotaxis protein
MVEQVIMNLAVNARDAMPKGGRLSIGTSHENITSEYASQNPDSRPGAFACMTVKDTGCGMDRKTLERIFEPFFTTKEVGKGTGLGLATVYGIVKQHQGWVEVTSQVGVGTTFKVFLPQAAKKESAATESSTDSLKVRGGPETILLVEDEAVLRELVREVLVTYDYKVVEASSGVEALKIWDQNNGKIDLLLTDMVMPEGVSGSDLAAQLKKRKPNLKVIFTSGYSADVLGKNFNQTDTLFLAKPYFPPQLARLVRQCLDTSQAAVATEAEEKQPEAAAVPVLAEAK